MASERNYVKCDTRRKTGREKEWGEAIIVSNNAVSLVRNQAIIWANAHVLFIEVKRTTLSENQIKVQQYH